MLALPVRKLPHVRENKQHGPVTGQPSTGIPAVVPLHVEKHEYPPKRRGFIKAGKSGLSYTFFQVRRGLFSGMTNQTLEQLR